ncbi:hypothetical protein JTB14_012044 [Gonioctena quinquepunctata]|nr:hypothetical protein JTB14_012044 [Gonioctena quinquepunctata]
MEITRLCFVREKTKAVKKAGIQTLIRYSKGYNDNKWKLFEEKSEILVHKRCNLYYSTGSFKIPGVVDSPAPCRSSRASSTEVFDFDSLCLFCQKNWMKSSTAKYAISADIIKDKILRVAA